MKKNSFQKFYKTLSNYSKINTIKGYRIAKVKGRLYNLEEIKEEITNSQIKNFNSEREIVLRQFLLRYLMSYRFNIAFFKSLAKKSAIIYPLTDEWIKIIEKNGYKVNSFLSKVLLFFFSTIFYFKSFKTFFSLLFYSRSTFPKSDYVYFNNLSISNLPIDTQNSYDIFSWYCKKYQKNKNKISFVVNFKFKENEITNTFNIYQNKYCFPSLNIFKKLKLFQKFLILILKNLFWLILFNWKKIILTEEKIYCIYVDLLKKKDLASEYWFNISEFVYRPLWTYLVEDNSKIILYNYSCSFLGHKLLNKYRPEEVGIGSMNWPYVFQWSKKYNEYLIDKTSKTISYKLVEPIWFIDKKVNLNLNNNKKSLVIFDVSPSNFLRMCELNYNIYRNNKCAKLFIKDILEVSNNLNLSVYIKLKRELDLKYHSKIYSSFIDEIQKLNIINFVDTKVSPFNLIKSTDMNISIPFTSTAVIGNYYNKPSCFYDPIEKIDNSDRAAQGIEIVKGKKKLISWMNDNI